MALEMRNRVRNEFGVDVPFAQIVQGLSTAGLASLILEDLGLGSPTASQGDEASLQALELESAVQGGYTCCRQTGRIFGTYVTDSGPGQGGRTKGRSHDRTERRIEPWHGAKVSTSSR